MPDRGHAPLSEFDSYSFSAGHRLRSALLHLARLDFFYNKQVNAHVIANPVWAWRTRALPYDYLVFYALLVAVMVSHSSTMGNLRYVTGCFPGFVALAVLLKKPTQFSLALGLFAGLLGLFASLYATGQQHNLGYHFAAF